MVQHTKEEIREAMFEMRPKKHQRKMNSHIYFLRNADILLEKISPLNGGMEVSPINSTHIVFVPKIANPSNMTHFDLLVYATYFIKYWQRL